MPSSSSSDNKGGGESESHEDPDWAEIYSDLLCHTSISIFEIHEMTIPQINTIRTKLGKNIAIKIGMPGIFCGALDNPSPPSPTGKPSKLSDFMNFANTFNGI